MKKVVLAVMLCVLLALSMSLPAFAASIGTYINPYYYDISDVQIYYNSAWHDPSSYTFGYSSDTEEARQGIGRLYISWGAAGVSGNWRAKFTPKDTAGTMYVEPSYYLDCTMTYFIDSGLQHTPSGSMFVTTPQGVTYEFPMTDYVSVVPSSTLTGYTVTFGGQVTVGDGFNTGDSTIEFVCYAVSGSSAVDIDLNQVTFIVSEKPLSGNTATIVESVDKAAQDIIANQEANTEEIKDAIGDAADQIGDDIQNSADQITGSIDDAVNEDFGYEDSESQGDAEAGIADLKTQIDSLSNDIKQSVEDFEVSIDGLSGSMEQGKQFVWGWLDYVPAWFTAVVVGLAGLLIARKIVK